MGMKGPARGAAPGPGATEQPLLRSAGWSAACDCSVGILGDRVLGRL